MLSIRELNSYKQFQDLEYVWNNHLRRCSDNEIFLTWEWLSTWWKHYGRKRKLMILLAEEDTEIIGIAPLMHSTYKLIVGIELIQFIGTPKSDYNNFILIKKKEACLGLFLKYLESYSMNWGLIDLQDIPNTSESFKVWRNVSQSLPNTKERVLTACPYVVLPDSFEVFFESLGRKLRKNLRRSLRKLKNEHTVKLQSYNEIGSVKEMMNVFFRLHQKRWSSRGTRGFLADQITRDFHLDIAENFSKNRWLALHFLTVDERPVAAAYGFEYRQKMYSYLTGFDPLYEAYGVGNLLYMFLLQRCIENGLKEFDFTRGDEPYKRRWNTNDRFNIGIQLEKDALVHRMHHWASRIKSIPFLSQTLQKYSAPS